MPEPRVFHSTLRVRSYELDVFGHVNHSVFLQWLEDARVAALGEAGFPWEDLARRGRQVHMVRVEIDYRAAANLGDEVRIETSLERVGTTSMTMRQVARRGETVLADARVTGVWIGSNGRPAPVPAELRAALEG